MRTFHTPVTIKMERALFAEGYRCIAGLDEVGRGAWAGPLLAGAILVTPQELPRCRRLRRLVRDSKTLSVGQRERAFGEITSSVRWGIGLVTPEELDCLGMSQSNQLALDRAVAALAVVPECLLVDGRGFRFRQPYRLLADGDARVFCIAAAAIVAKVTRDRLMTAQHHRYPAYGFDRHKGYGTRAHQAALKQRGPCPIHRQSFAPIANLVR